MAAWIRRLTGTALIAGLALAAPAAGDPVPLTQERTIDPLPVGVAFDGASRGIASWRTFVGKPGEGSQHHLFTITDSAGNWRPPVKLAGNVLEHEFAVSGHRAAFAVNRLVPAGRNRLKSVVKVVIVDTASGAVRRVHTLAVGTPQRIDPEGTAATLWSPRVAAAPHGDFVVVWVRSTSRSTAGVWMTTLHPNGRFDAPRRIGPLGGSPMLSIARDGRGVLAWQRGHRIQVRVRRASGTWGPIELAGTTIGAVTWGVDSIDVAAANGWKFAVGVLQTARSAAGVRIYTTVHLRNGSGVWRSSVIGDFRYQPDGASTYVTDLPHVVTFAAGNRLHAAWPALAGGHAGALAAAFAVNASAVVLASEPVTLSPATGDVALEDATGRADGSFAAIWFGGDTVGLTEVDAAGIAHLTPGLATERAYRGAKVAIDSRSGRLLAVWGQGTPPAGNRPVAWMK